MIKSIIRFFNIILVAVLAGVSFGIWIGFNPIDLSPSAFVEQQQNLVRSLRALLIALAVITTIITIVSAFMQKQNRPVFNTLLIAAGFLIACILITRFGNKPIDDQIMTWRVDALPSNWLELRNQWRSFHIMRSIAELAALILITWASVRKDELETSAPQFNSIQTTKTRGIEVIP